MTACGPPRLLSPPIKGGTLKANMSRDYALPGKEPHDKEPEY